MGFVVVCFFQNFWISRLSDFAEVAILFNERVLQLPGLCPIVGFPDFLDFPIFPEFVKFVDFVGFDVFRYWWILRAFQFWQRLLSLILAFLSERAVAGFTLTLQVSFVRGGNGVIFN